MSAAADIEEAIDELRKAVRLVADLQADCVIGDSLWHKLETIDDRLHDALTKLGD